MSLKLVLSLSVLLASNSAFAKPEIINIPAECATPEELGRALSEYGEKIMWYSDRHAFAINSNTKSWTLIRIYPEENVACIVGEDKDLQQYVPPNQRRFN